MLVRTGETDLCNPAEGHAQVVRVPLAVSLVVLIVLLVEDGQTLLTSCDELQNQGRRLMKNTMVGDHRRRGVGPRDTCYEIRTFMRCLALTMPSKHQK